MSAFGVTTEFITNDFGSVIGTTVSIPIDAITWADKSARISSGGSARIPVNNIVWVNKTPRISAGARVNVPVQPWIWTDKTLRKSSGKSVFVPLGAPLVMSTNGARISSGGSARIPKDNLTMTTDIRMSSGGSVYSPVTTLTWIDKTIRKSSGKSVFIPRDVTILWADKTSRITSGGSARIPKDNLTFTTVVSMRSGGSTFIPKDNLSWSDKIVRKSSGKSVFVPPDVVITWVDKTPRITTGVFIGIDTSGLMNLNAGVTSEGITSEFMTLEGEALTRISRLPDRIVFQTFPVKMSSGGSARIPKDNLVITEQRVEIGARRRRLRTAAIAS